ncbi:hypothetical protein LWC34_17645 [Kibdelosporangium philippinense]|uniref:Uncharacterized protein n=1 Tax=Kibdelosporangium philippinense TaxID=211113 RepID=A0ABS8Z9U3_9PSEU|nr:hypothetical protein [Kibdelosporangium philippinense]MCE7004634.1 hypothetical protein [Kibdelosporangium philippinense]
MAEHRVELSRREQAGHRRHDRRECPLRLTCRDPGLLLVADEVVLDVQLDGHFARLPAVVVLAAQQFRALGGQVCGTVHW